MVAWNLYRDGEALGERIKKLKLELERLEEKQATLKDGKGPPTDTVELEYCESAKMAADIFAKPFVNADKWQEVCEFIGIKVKHKNPIWTERDENSNEESKKEKSPETLELSGAAKEAEKKKKAARKITKFVVFLCKLT